MVVMYTAVKWYDVKKVISKRGPLLSQKNREFERVTALGDRDDDGEKLSLENMMES